MKKIVLLTVLILLLSSVYLFSAVPCKINYQGRLIKDNVPVDGQVNMEFKLWTDETSADQIYLKKTISLGNVPVYNGLFRVVLDLGDVDWTAGQVFYLEVKAGNDTLTPREPIYAYPYAINSHLLEGQAKDYFLNTSAETQTKQGNLNIMGNLGIGTTSPTHKLDVRGPLRIDQSSTYDVWIQGGSATSGTSRNLALLGIKSYDELWLNVGGEYTGGVRIQGSKTMIDGNLGIGTTSPNYALDVASTIRTRGQLRITGNNPGTGWTDTDLVVGDTSANRHDSSISIMSATSAGKLKQSGDTLSLTCWNDADIATFKTNKIIATGNVGIGTTSPGAKLEVAGNLRATGGIEPDWDSGWVWVDRIGAWGLKTLTHNLNYFPRQIQWWFSNGNPGTFIGPLASNTYRDHGGNPLGIWITLTQVNFSIWHDRYVYRMWNASTQQWSSYNNGYYRILLWR